LEPQSLIKGQLKALGGERGEESFLLLR
jgi:hypothetical protein